MTRYDTHEERAKWAAYMREYRRRNAGRKPTSPRAAQPTARQLEILRLYADPAQGGSQAKVAEALGISVSAVHNQLQALMRRLGVNSPAQAVYKVWVSESKEDA